MTGSYYNEIDPFAAQWLRNLIAAGFLPNGDVDERSIVDVQPDDLAGYVQCHFFAGIGGWPYALSLADWPEDEPVWTGSCPCQPLSVAGQRKGHVDERHLWPAFHRLIAECKPPTVFGEQVASKDGREWLAGVRADLEALGYACGAADLCAASVGAPHRRQRLYWLGDTDRARLPQRLNDRGEETGTRPANPWEVSERAGGRRIKPGVRLLAYGIPGRLGKLRGFGNAVVPQVAAQFIAASMEAA
jgi:DNA (cytosine-5)-methyltransferase 1